MDCCGILQRFQLGSTVSNEQSQIHAIDMFNNNMVLRQIIMQYNKCCNLKMKCSIK